MIEFQKLSDVAELTVGYVGTMGKEYSSQGVLFLRSLNIKPFGFDLSDIKYIPDEFHRKLNKSALHTNDVVIVRTGVPGTCAVIPPELDGCNCADLVIVRPNQAVIDPYFLCAFINSWGRAQVSNAKVGAVQKHFNVTSAEEMLIPVIDIQAQKAVSDLLRNINNKIHVNDAICTDLEAMAKLLYDYWFVQFDFPDENGKPYKSSGGKMEWNEDLKREIPEGWEVSRVGDMISTERGISYSTPNIATGQGVPMLNLATFMPGGGDYKADGLKHFLGEYPQNKVLKPYELIMCNTQQTAIKFETDIIGRAMLVPDIFDSDVVFSHHVNVIRTLKEDMKYYLLYLFNSDYYHKYISGFTNGTNILGLSFNGVEDYLSEVPDEGVLKQFGARILEFEKKKSQVLLENQQLASLRDFLLPLLMNGQVKVGEIN